MATATKVTTKCKSIKATRPRLRDNGDGTATWVGQADLRRKRPRAKMVDSDRFPGSRAVGKRKGVVKNQDKPIGQIALFLVHKLGRLDWSPSDFAAKITKAGLLKDHEAVRKWLNGSNAPRLTEMDVVAKVLGYDDWVALIVAVGKYNKRHG